MSKCIRKFIFVETWRIGESESWLSDMSAQGLHLVKYGRAFAYFNNGEPLRYRYRIDISYSQLNDSYTSLFTEFGWEFVCRCNMFNIFRSPENIDVTELHTDTAEQSFTLHRLKRRLVVSALFGVLAVLLALLSLYFSISVGNTPVLKLVEGQGFGIFVSIPLYLIVLSISLNAVLSTKKLIRSMRFGYPINHNANWKPYKRLSIFLLIAVILVGSVGIFLPSLQLMLMRTTTLPLVNDNQMILRLSDIEDNDKLERWGSYIQHNVDWGNSVRYKWSPLAPLQLSVNEHGIVKGKMWLDSNIEEYSPNLEYQLFKLNFSFLADSLINDITKKMDSWYSIHNDSPNIIEIKNSSLDKLLVRESESGNYCEVFASKGSYVVYVKYYGEKDIDTVVNAVIEHMLIFN